MHRSGFREYVDERRKLGQVLWPAYLFPGPDRVGEHPIIGTYWYLRDLAVLLLMTPVLKRIARPLFIVLVVFSVFDPQLYYEHIGTLVSPFALSMFLLGCVIRSFSREGQERVLHMGSRVAVAAFWSFCLFFFLNDICCWIDWPKKTGLPLLYAIFSMAMLYQTSVLLARYFPRLAGLAVKLAPAIYLAYVTHDMLRMLIERHWAGTHVMALLPIADFALCWGIYYGLSHCSPVLLRLVAYAKAPARPAAKSA